VHEVATSPTGEQQDIIDAARTGAGLVIEAGAGTGKTSTLVMVSEVVRGRGLYVAFNNAIVADARRRFNAEVTCATAHHLAYIAVGHMYAARINGPRMRYAQVAASLGLPAVYRLGERTRITRYHVVRLAFAAVRAFCRSADDTLARHHVPRPDGFDGDSAAEITEVVLDAAIELWADLGDPAGIFPFQHDYYLKMWSLLKPILNYDYLLFDEAQDADPLIASIVQAQPCQQVAVGDRNQAIYGWRGAVDALEDWPAIYRLPLTQSWRFGDQIAEQANLWLSALGAPLRLSGNPSINSRVGPDPHAHAVLCRTNAEAVTEVIHAIQGGRRTALIGGASAIVRLARASQELKDSGVTDHPELFAFSSWRDVQEYAEHDDGNDLRRFVRLVDDLGAAQIIAIGGQLDDEHQADLVVSTCHKTKGREWDTVRIGRDFDRHTHGQAAGVPALRREDAMLAYVAVTRARSGPDHSAQFWFDAHLKTEAGVAASVSL
jgi:hypothetical protein